MRGPGNKTRTFYALPEDIQKVEDAKLLLGGNVSVSKLVFRLLGEWLDKEDPTGRKRKSIKSSQVILTEKA